MAEFELPPRPEPTRPDPLPTLSTSKVEKLQRKLREVESRTKALHAQSYASRFRDGRDWSVRSVERQIKRLERKHQKLQAALYGPEFDLWPYMRPEHRAN